MLLREASVGELTRHADPRPYAYEGGCRDVLGISADRCDHLLLREAVARELIRHADPKPYPFEGGCSR
jgi:hypothetical protein